VSTRGFDNPSKKFVEGKDNLFLLKTSFAPEEMEFIYKVSPAAIFNHVSWDLNPIAKDWWCKDRRPLIVSFMHSRGVMQRLSPERFDISVVFSHYLADAELEERFSPAQNSAVRWMPNCIDEREFIALPLQGRFRAGEFVIGNITNGAPWKHSRDFIDICESIAIPNVRFEFLGATDLEAKVQTKPYINILPAFSLHVPTYLSGVSVLIHKTRSDIAETWGRTITEAMFAGIPVVAEKKGGIREQIVDGKTGFLCENEGDFTKCVEALYFDEGLYQEISRNAREHAKANFGLRICRENLLHLLSN
jgi:glycosyltransferase involved in cell wall biosynthesis